MEKKPVEQDTRVPLPRGTALTIKIGKEKKRLTVRKLISFGRECLVYLAESTDAGGSGREAVVREFYPADLSVQRRGAKLVPPRGGRDRFRAQLQRFLEGKTVFAGLYPPGAPLFGYGTANGTGYAVTDPSAGETLRLVKKGESLSEGLSLVRDTAEELKALHGQGILYLAFRPEHIFVTRDKTARLLDVDQAAAENALPERIPAFAGFAAPEQMRGERDKVSKASDVYALGALLFAKLTGRTPEEEERRAILNGSFSYEEKMPFLAGNAPLTASIGRILASCLADSPQDRSMTAAQAAEQLDALLKIPGQMPKAAVTFAEAEPRAREPLPEKRARRGHMLPVCLVILLLAMNLAVYLGPREWLRPLEAPVAAVQGWLQGEPKAAAPSPADGRYQGSVTWQGVTFQLDQKASGSQLMLRYQVGETACAVGRGATATAVTEAGSYTVPLLSAGQTLRPGASGICPLQFAQMEGTVGYLILYGLIPLNPDGVTAAQETTSITMEVNYLSPSP